MVRNKTCTLVINGVHARILRGLEDGSTEEPIEICSKAGSTHLGEILSDNYGRAVMGALSPRMPMGVAR